jgi:hypothetical protein
MTLRENSEDRIEKYLKSGLSRMLVAHAYNPTYSGRSQFEASLLNPVSKIPSTKKGWWSGSSGRAPA